MHLWQIALHLTGSDNASGPWYLFWSGIVGDLGLFGGMAMIYKKHNCHVHWCWRLGHFAISGTPYMVCKKHHPALPTLTI